MIQKIYEISCDNCLTVLMHTYTLKSAIKELKKAGWRRFGDKEYCKDCSSSPTSVKI